MHRSYLFAPGHNEKLLGRVFKVGADAVMLDLEDAVPPHAKAQARSMVADVLVDREAWVRINAVGTELVAADLEAVTGLAAGIRIPKVESARDVEWVHDRAPDTPLICAIESARGILAAQEIASAPGVRHLSLGGIDLRRTSAPPTATCRRSTPVRTSSWSRAPPASIPPSTASTRIWMTRPGYAPKPSSPAHSGSSASRRSTHGNSRSSTTSSPLRRRARMGAHRARRVRRSRRRSRQAARRRVRRPPGCRPRPTPTPARREARDQRPADTSTRVS